MKTKVTRLIFVALGAFIIFKFILFPVWITGRSMEPTYHDGDLTFINRLAYFNQSPARTDIVAIRMSGLSAMYLKRIIALPGETVAIEDGVVKINGTILDEPYVSVRAPWQIPAVVLRPDEYYVIGDNRSVSAEEHLFGRVKDDRIVGRPLW